MREEFTITVYW